MTKIKIKKLLGISIRKLPVQKFNVKAAKEYSEIYYNDFEQVTSAKLEKMNQKCDNYLPKVCKQVILK